MSASLGNISNLTVAVEERTYDTHIASDQSTPAAERMVTLRRELLLKDGSGNIIEVARTVERVAAITVQLTGAAKTSAEYFKPIRRYTAFDAEAKEPGIGAIIIATHESIVDDQKAAEKLAVEAAIVAAAAAAAAAND